METLCGADLLLVAVLYRAQVTRFTDNHEFSTIFGNAACCWSDNWGQFALHPQYKDSPTLADAISTLKLGGSLIWVGGTRDELVSIYVLGEYGREKYENLPSDIQSQVDLVAEELRAITPKQFLITK